jgi:hypothetical protein
MSRPSEPPSPAALLEARDAALWCNALAGQVIAAAKLGDVRQTVQALRHLRKMVDEEDKDVVVSLGMGSLLTCQSVALGRTIQSGAGPLDFPIGYHGAVNRVEQLLDSTASTGVGALFDHGGPA